MAQLIAGAAQGQASSGSANPTAPNVANVSARSKYTVRAPLNDGLTRSPGCDGRDGQIGGKVLVAVSVGGVGGGRRRGWVSAGNIGVGRNRGR
ncbi:MAG: hypothetical protein U1E59_19505 [Amaricoccus sp.]